ncbi:MAG: transposase [Patescibacteria group bacterium]
MKNRDYKQYAPNTFYHVLNRGVAQSDIFLDDEDYNFFLFRLHQALYPNFNMGRVTLPQELKRHPFPKNKRDYSTSFIKPDSYDLVSYCLMPNHFHLLIKQNGEVPVTKLIGKVCTSYSMYFNRKYQRVGTLFQDTFKAIAVEDNNYLFWLTYYIHKNPKEAGLVKNLKDWFWSSFPDYIGIREGQMCKKEIILEQLSSKTNYSKLFEDGTKNKEPLLLRLYSLE